MSCRLRLLLSVAVVILAASQALAQPAKGRWDMQKSGVEDDLQSAAFTSDDVGIVVGKNNTILKTTDGGKTWKRVVPRNGKGPNLGQVLFANAKEGWAVTNIVGTILHTTDGGDTWKSVAVPGPGGVFGLSGSHHCTHAAVDSNYYYLVWGLNGSHLYHKSNAGAAWTRMNKEMNLEKLSGNGLSFPDTKNGHYVNARKIPREFYAGVSSDGGKTWMEQRLKGNLKGNYLRTHFVNKDLGWLIPQAGDIHVTTDGGKTWTPQKLGHNENDTLVTLHFLDAQVGHVLCAGSNQVRRTTDGGKSWHSLGTIMTKVHLNSMSFPGSTHGWVVGDQGVIAHYEEAKGK